MPKLEVRDGIELYYEELGSGDKYVLSLMMDFPPENATRALADHGYHVFLITNRGIGQSTHVFEDYGNDWFDIFADDVAAFADKLGIDRFVYKEANENQTPEERAVNYRRPMIKYETEANVQAALRTIQTPVLMIGALEDPISRPDLMLRTAQCIPHGKTILYSGFGHGGPYTQIVEETVSETLFFLKNVEETGRVYQKVEG